MSSLSSPLSDSVTFLLFSGVDSPSESDLFSLPLLDFTTLFSAVSVFKILEVLSSSESDVLEPLLLESLLLFVATLGLVSSAPVLHLRSQSYLNHRC